jgi:hypothetical protein
MRRSLESRCCHTSPLLVARLRLGDCPADVVGNFSTQRFVNLTRGCSIAFQNADNVKADRLGWFNILTRRLAVAE